MTAILGWFRIFTVVACGTCLSAEAIAQREQMGQMNATSSFAGEMMQSMSKMDRDMLAAPMTGDPNHDFSAMMIPHHQGAIDMAKAFLLHGQDSPCVGWLRRL